jgi:hypothetical protein
MSEINPDFNANKVTLMYLANAIYQEEQEKNESVNKKKERDDFKFYRKRIHAFSKELLKGKYPNDTIKKAHKTFIKHVINYFKVTDRVDILQEEHKNTMLSIPEIDCNQQLPIDATIEEANECIMRTSLQPLATMDQFVNIKKLKIDQPDPPRRKKINIKTEHHKRKGIKKKNSEKKSIKKIN